MALSVSISRSSHKQMGDNKQEVPEDIVKCSECGSRELYEDKIRGEKSCVECGLVLEEKIIDEKSGRDRHDDPEQGDQHTLPELRTGAQIQLDNAILAKRDFSGRGLTDQQRRRSLRNLLHQRNSRKDERSEAQKLCEKQLEWLVANNELRCNKVGVDDIFKKAIEKKKANRADKNTNSRGSFLTAGLPNDAGPASAVAACIFHCRRNNDPGILLDDFIDEQCKLSEQNVTPCGRFAGNHKLFRKQVKRALKHVDEIFQRKDKSGRMAQARDIPKGMQRVKGQSYARDEFIGVVKEIGCLIPNLTKAEEEKIGKVLQEFESLPPTITGCKGLYLEICYQLARLDRRGCKRGDFINKMGSKFKPKRIDEKFKTIAETVLMRARNVERGNKEHSIKRSDSDKGERKDENN